MEALQYQVVIPEKSPNDKRLYKALKLQNGLSVLLIHDNQIEKSACAISVNVGSLSDPDRSLGLAHFLQHMLFMGSSKYPSQNQYSSFISLNAGLDNAYTSDTETNYFFQIATTKFLEGVDRLAEFFNAALLNPGSIEKQRQAVHQQYMRWANDDNCKKWGIIHAIGNGNFSRFSIGNQQTLNHQNIRDDLVAFYTKNYSANIIKAVLSSNLSIQQLQKNLDCLRKIPNKNVELQEFDEPFLRNQLGKHIRIQSIKDQYILQFIWIIENLKPLYRKHIDQYITQILGHQGQNSLFSLLKKKTLASELSSWNHNIVKATMIGVQIKLTQSGKSRVQQIINIVCQYINSLNAEQVYYNEVKERNKLDFTFQQKYSNSRYVCQLASRMHHIPIQNILNYTNLNDDFDPILFNYILRQLNPTNLLIFQSNIQKIENSLNQKYLNTNYKIKDISQLKISNNIYKSIAPNPFLPVDLTLYQSVPNVPRNISQNIVFLQDYRFKVVKGGIQIKVSTQLDELFRIVYAEWLQVMLKQLTYPAQILKVSIQYNKNIQIRLFGYNDAVLKLVNIIGQNIIPLHEKIQDGQNIFNIVLEKSIQQFGNLLLSSSDEIADFYQELLLEGKSSQSVSQIIQRLEKFNFKQFLQLGKNLWHKCYFEWTVVGNFEQKSILKVANEFQSYFNRLQQIQIPQNPCLKIQRNISFEEKVDCQDLTTSCTIVYYQVGQNSYNLQMILQIIRLYIAEPYFDELRTKRQLAYYLRASIATTQGILGLKFILQSSNTDAYSVGLQIKQFVKSFLGKFNEKSEQQLQKLKSSVLIKLSQPHNNLKQLNKFIIDEVRHRTYLFNRKQKSVIQQQLKKITKQDIIKVINKLLDYSLDIYVVAKCHFEQYNKNQIKIESIKDIKNNANYHVDLYHYNLKRKC